MQTIHVVQQFEKQGKRLVAGRMMQFKTPQEAIGRAERDAARCAGVAAVTQVVDPESGEVEGEPVILARHGDLPAELAGD